MTREFQQSFSTAPKLWQIINMINVLGVWVIDKPPNPLHLQPKSQERPSGPELQIILHLCTHTHQTQCILTWQFGASNAASESDVPGIWQWLPRQDSASSLTHIIHATFVASEQISKNSQLFGLPNLRYPIEQQMIPFLNI